MLKRFDGDEKALEAKLNEVRDGVSHIHRYTDHLMALPFPDFGWKSRGSFPQWLLTEATEHWDLLRRTERLADLLVQDAEERRLITEIRMHLEFPFLILSCWNSPDEPPLTPEDVVEYVSRPGIRHRLVEASRMLSRLSALHRDKAVQRTFDRALGPLKVTGKANVRVPDPPKHWTQAVVNERVTRYRTENAAAFARLREGLEKSTGDARKRILVAARDLFGRNALGRWMGLPKGSYRLIGEDPAWQRMADALGIPRGPRNGGAARGARIGYEMAIEQKSIEEYEDGDFDADESLENEEQGTAQDGDGDDLVLRRQRDTLLAKLPQVIRRQVQDGFTEKGTALADQIYILEDYVKTMPKAKSTAKRH